MGRDGHQEDSYSPYYVLQSPKYNHAVREKGDRVLVVADDIPPPVISASPPPTDSESVASNQLENQICSRSDLKSNEPIDSLVWICASWYVTKVHHDSPSCAPDSAVAQDYSIFLVQGDPEILRKAFKEME